MPRSVRLRLVPQDADFFKTRTVLTRPEGYVGDTRFFSGDDSRAPDLLCERCGAPLVTGALVAPNFVFQCGSCRAFNENTAE
jgi:hypothetical protein